MKRGKRWLIVLLCLAVIVGGILAASAMAGRRPYKDLTAADIQSATVQLTPPDTTLEIPDTAELAEYLSQVVIYGRDDSYTEYAGQGVVFTLHLADGSTAEVMAYNPFLVIDGVGYRTKYEPCEALNRYANGLLGSGEAVVVLEKPPALTVVSDNTTVEAMLGGYQWEKTLADGTVEHALADSAHPLDCRELLTLLDTREGTAELEFAQMPNEIFSARCWSDVYWGEPETAGEPVTVEDGKLTLKPGRYVYEVGARWDTASGYGGTAYYAFYIDYTAE